MTDANHAVAVANLRHLYRNLVSGAVPNAAAAKSIAEGLLGPAIKVLESAPTHSHTPLTLAQMSAVLGGEVQEGSFPYACARAIERAHGISELHAEDRRAPSDDNAI